MHWPLLRRRDRHEEPGERTRPRETPREELHHSLGLEEVVSHLHHDRPFAVLDLGPAAGPSVDFLSGFRCHLQIVDLLGAVAGEPATPDDLPALIERALPAGRERFDLVLAWDTFDFLERAPARILAGHLARLSRYGATLLAIVATGPEPLPPATAYAIIDGKTLRYRPRTLDVIRQPPFTPAGLESLLDGFRAEHSYVLRHHVHEWVAVRED